MTKKELIKKILTTTKQDTTKQRVALVKRLEELDLISFNGGEIFSFGVYFDDDYNQAIASLCSFNKGEGDMYYDIDDDQEWHDFIKYVGRVNHFCNNQ